eukprot:Nk52_evm28s1485 gene=Nk52_evmTU28s1485
MARKTFYSVNTSLFFLASTVFAVLGSACLLLDWIKVTDIHYANTVQDMSQANSTQEYITRQVLWEFSDSNSGAQLIQVSDTLTIAQALNLAGIAGMFLAFVLSFRFNMNSVDVISSGYTSFTVVCGWIGALCGLGSCAAYLVYVSSDISKSDKINSNGTMDSRSVSYEAGFQYYTVGSLLALVSAAMAHGGLKPWKRVSPSPKYEHVGVKSGGGRGGKGKKKATTSYQDDFAY